MYMPHVVMVTSDPINFPPFNHLTLSIKVILLHNWRHYSKAYEHNKIWLMSMMLQPNATVSKIVPLSPLNLYILQVANMSSTMTCKHVITVLLVSTHFVTIYTAANYVNPLLNWITTELCWTLSPYAHMSNIYPLIQLFMTHKSTYIRDNHREDYKKML